MTGAEGRITGRTHRAVHLLTAVALLALVVLVRLPTGADDLDRLCTTIVVLSSEVPPPVIEAAKQACP